jgi:hypothetical protein
LNARHTRILNALRARQADVRQKIDALQRTIAQDEDTFTWTHRVVTKRDSIENVLSRLMVQDRARLERQQVPTVDDDLFSKLHVIAIAASRTRDLRFIDALNYYYELLSNFTPSDSEDSTLLFVSFLQSYAEALNRLSKEIAGCA